MSNSKDIFKALVSEDLVNAKKLINEALLAKLGSSLEEKLVDFAPSVFNEEKGGNKELTPNQARIARLAGDPKEIDAEDFKVLRGRRGRGNKNESVENNEELEAIAEEFEQELFSLVEEIETELGEELSEDEIKELADELLEAMNEEEGEEEGEEEESAEKSNQTSPTNKPTGGVEY